MGNNFVKVLTLAVTGKQQVLENVMLIHFQELVRFINIIQIKKHPNYTWQVVEGCLQKLRSTGKTGGGGGGT